MAWAKVVPARSAMMPYALRKPKWSRPTIGPGCNSKCGPAASPPRNCTSMHERLSVDPRFNARRHTAAAATPKSALALSASASLICSAANSITSRLGKLPSEMPSQTRTRKSFASHSSVVNSGSAETGWSSCLGPPVSLCGASPNARLTARSPFTRATPWTNCTVPPVRSIRSCSLGWSGLWSVVRPPSVPGPSTMLPSALPSSTRLSPMLPTRSLQRPPAMSGCTNANVPVEPLGAPDSRNSRSIFSIRSLTAASSGGSEPLDNSSVKRFATKAEH
mmetsp:Transcript_69458/g.201629  ORF Transcript_69458/g.201629 Transcript_69458/m.201629 type:complete len:277 (+) Transcript_69458:27-857(+)